MINHEKKTTEKGKEKEKKQETENEREMNTYICITACLLLPTTQDI
jgi:hypothetical protein